MGGTSNAKRRKGWGVVVPWRPPSLRRSTCTAPAGALVPPTLGPPLLAPPPLLRPLPSRLLTPSGTDGAVADGAGAAALSVADGALAALLTGWADGAFALSLFWPLSFFFCFSCQSPIAWARDGEQRWDQGWEARRWGQGWW
jgi:hypothetical protein